MATLEQAAATCEWSHGDQMEVLREYIRNQCSQDAFEDFLDRKVDAARFYRSTQSYEGSLEPGDEVYLVTTTDTRRRCSKTEVLNVTDDGRFWVTHRDGAPYGPWDVESGGFLGKPFPGFGRQIYTEKPPDFDPKSDTEDDTPEVNDTDMGSERRMQLDAVRKLWESLGDVPIDEGERIELPFLSFPAGTHREEIWHWFEETLGVKVAYLMHAGDNVTPWVWPEGRSN